MSKKNDYLIYPTLSDISKRDKDLYLENNISVSDLLKKYQELEKEKKKLEDLANDSKSIQNSTLKKYQELEEANKKLEEKNKKLEKLTNDTRNIQNTTLKKYQKLEKEKKKLEDLANALKSIHHSTLKKYQELEEANKKLEEKNKKLEKLANDTKNIQNTTKKSEKPKVEPVYKKNTTVSNNTSTKTKTTTLSQNNREKNNQSSNKLKPKLTVWFVVIALAITAGIGYLIFGQKNSFEFQTNEDGKILFGTYQGRTIEWIELDEKEDGSQLLLSKYVLLAKEYNDEFEDVTWETCTLREYLNNDFYTDAFSSEERSKIQKTTVINDDNPTYGTEGGNDTEDYIFLLSMDEANKYFSSDEERECKPTEYAKGQGIDVNDYAGNYWYWLRSPGNSSDLAADVRSNGVVSESGNYVFDDCECVRPAMWVNL